MAATSKQLRNALRGLVGAIQDKEEFENFSSSEELDCKEYTTLCDILSNHVNDAEKLLGHK